MVIDGETYWEFSVKNGDRRYRYSYKSRSYDIEATSYALLAYIGNNDMFDAKPITRWLMSQRNRHGGYKTTQVGSSNCNKIQVMCTLGI